ncbi:MAG: CPBP family intramembrane metalloprotease [Sphingomonas sp.]|nr:CPBP family intramembrane metalloprotease [Sphingomonas sp.]
MDVIGGRGFSARLRGLGPVGIAAILVILAANLTIAPLGAMLALAWARIARVPWRDLGFRRPGSWLLTIAGGVVAGILLKLLLKAVILPLLGAPPLNAPFQYIVGNRPAMLSMVLTSLIAGGIGEEIVYRGFLFERLGRVFGQGTWGTIAIVSLTSLLFASIHIPSQGVYGGIQALFTGLTFGTVYALTRRLWLPMVVHASYDVTAILLIYYGAEGTVARSVFG